MKVAVLCLFLVIATAVKLPSNFHKCSRKRSDFDDCVFKAAQHGILQLNRPFKEINIPSLEPFELPEASIDGGNGPVGLNQTFKNCKFYGFNTMQLEVFKFDFNAKTLDVVGTMVEVRMVCDYVIKGRVLLLPVNGYGNSTITLKNLKVTDQLHFEEHPMNGKTLMKFTSSHVSLDPELVIFNFESHVDKSITNNLNPILNEHWKEIFYDVKGGYEQIIDSIITSLCNGFFKKVSVEEAFEDA